MTDTRYILNLDEVDNQKRDYLETIFSLGNGQIGVRAGLPFISSVGNPGMFVNGFYGTSPIVYGEKAFGYAEQHQTIITLYNPKIINIVLDESDQLINGDWQIELSDMQLDMTRNIVTEYYRLISTRGNILNLKVTTIVATNHNEIGLQFNFSSENYQGPIKIERRLIESAIQNEIDEVDPRIANRKLPISMNILDKQTTELSWRVTSDTSKQYFEQSEKVAQIPSTWAMKTTDFGFIINGRMDDTVDYQIDFSRLISAINHPLSEETAVTLSELIVHNEKSLAQFWQQSDVEIKGNVKLQKGIRYNIFQLYQSAGRDGQTNISAKGVSGAGYEGHYFWDTEMYMLPFFIYTNPEIARQLLMYRYNVLGEAQKRAQIMGAEGALFAWRTINGQELSAYYPAGTAQVHINGDIAYAVKQYYEVTRDEQFLIEFGAKIVLETARFWLSYGAWFQKDGHQFFGIFKVTGPDEYTALVNNNYYTNRIAQENIRFAIWLLNEDKIQAGANEELVAELQKAADAMYLPYDSGQKVIQQDDESPMMPTWPFETTPENHYPLLMHYHPLEIYRHRVNKQADTLLSEMLFQEDVDTDQLLRDFNYYSRITTHDSSLSRSIFGIIASRLNLEIAYDYYMDSALMDLTDLQGNSGDGLHAANLGGSWLGITYGFANLHLSHGYLALSSHLPDALTEVKFKLNYRQALLMVTVTKRDITVRRLTGPKVQLKISGVVQTL